MKLSVRVFAGMRPARSADLLSPGEAQFAQNTRLTAGALEPFRGLATFGVAVPGPPVKSIYRFGQTNTNETEYWFQSTIDTNYVKGPIDNDATERTYWTDGVDARKTDYALGTTSGAGSDPYPNASYKMGVPKPSLGTPLSLTVSGTPTDPTATPETVVYCLTYVSSWGEESAPSDASSSVNIRPGETVTVASIPVGPTSGGYNITGKRLYRSATGSDSTEFQLVNTEGDIPNATTSYADTKATSELGDTLATTGWAEPPADLKGLCGMANGMMAAFKENTLYFCEPFAPYAWPVKYTQSTDAPIVAIASFDQSLFVGTTQGVYVFTGTHPGAMSSDQLAVSQSCVSKRSVVSMLGGVIFASPDGLMRISSAGLQNLTDGLMTRVEWQAYVPSSIEAYESDNRYIAFFDTGSRQAGMVFSFGDSPTFSETDVYATCGYRDKRRDALYLGVSNTLNKWDSGTALTYTWTSGVFHLPTEVNMGAARIDAASYPVTFQLYANGAAVGSAKTVTSRYAFRLPSGYRDTRYHFTLTGSSIVREVTIAPTMNEIYRGD